MPIPKISSEYVEKMRGLKPQSKEKRQANLDAIVKGAGSKSAAMSKIGQGFIGPVQMRLKYEGMVRNVLTEDPIAPGQVPVYDVATEMGKAYFLDAWAGEAVISQYEGLRVMYTFRHLAEFATIQEQDLLELSIDMADYAINEARQRIQEKEDGYLFDLLDVAVDGFDADNPDFAGQTSHEVAAAGAFMPTDFYSAAAIVSRNRLQSTNIIINNADYYDMLAWDLAATSFKFRDDTFGGVPVTSFGPFRIWQSVVCEQGTAYVLPEADYLGRMPVRKSLEITENPKVENFSLGWVLDEFINELILNANGVVRVKKD